ncbi:hypothetical protein QWI17_19115 [Gilvimarinus sp. SDUM040013]|uniref:Uncharacterized protein n=1 Tax=Gilvimarinus gilvus TaxID=3058038 RepID=A0ABU4RWX0_9GAMM|nr:hypothetical protein [Gilvimarinus sp. SDUM040013]MDO3387963.1 hypothetical protein [Gilvimarinus sp. SDUM040013]MDX6848666.1 hypothetical protein [Gilvimarinus sp. SDUM040013]
MAFGKPDQKRRESTPFSDFIRNDSSAEKRRAYGDVLEKATERQQAQLKRAAELRKALQDSSV